MEHREEAIKGLVLKYYVAMSIFLGSKYLKV